MGPLVTIAVVLLLTTVAVATTAACSRRRFARLEGSFRCKVRAVGRPSALWPRLRPDWPRRPTWARWVGETLVVRQGLLGTRTVALAMEVADDGIRKGSSWKVRRCGRRPLLVDLVLRDDGSRVELAAPGRARIAMVGPYLAAALHALPEAPTGKRQSPRQG